jgi:hypothetical protein
VRMFVSAQNKQKNVWQARRGSDVIASVTALHHADDPERTRVEQPSKR